MDRGTCDALYQETVQLMEHIREKLQAQHAGSITHFPVTQEETDDCTLIVRRSESIMEEEYEVKLEELNALRTQLLQFVRSLGTIKKDE